ncbi:MAG: hypothetical protein GAK36_00148 [Pseudomonas sp.]|nr:MAG: hypothetical protein GAK36_00148 [Pseudomonas sp.]
MTLLLDYWKPLAAAIAIAMAASCGAIAEHWRMNAKLSDQAAAFQSDLSTINLAAAKAQNEADEQRQALAKAIQQQSTAQYQEYTNAKSQNDQLRSDLRDAKRRLSVAVSSCGSAAQVPGTPGTGRLDNESGRADIDPRSAERIVAIANRGDDAIRQLSACQAYVKKIVGE